MVTLTCLSSVSGDGSITIADFEDGIDLIDVRSLDFDDFDHLMDHSTPTTRGIVIDYADTTIDIYGIDPSAGDFILMRRFRPVFPDSYRQAFAYGNARMSCRAGTG